MAADQHYEHQGQSGEHVMLASGEMVPVAEYQPPKAAEHPKTAQPSKAKN